MYPNEDSDQPWHQTNQITVFTVYWMRSIKCFMVSSWELWRLQVRLGMPWLTYSLHWMQWLFYWFYLFPTTVNNVISMSMRHHDVTSTLVRHFDVMCLRGCLLTYFVMPWIIIIFLFLLKNEDSHLQVSQRDNSNEYPYNIHCSRNIENNFKPLQSTKMGLKGVKQIDVLTW